MKKQTESSIFVKVAAEIKRLLFIEKKPLAAGVMLGNVGGNLSIREFKQLDTLIKRTSNQRVKGGSKGTFFPCTSGHKSSANRYSQQQ